MADDSNQSTLTIRILGRDYPIACPDGERDTLLSSAEYLARRMQAIQKRGKALGADQIAVMAALNTARELLALQQEVAQLRTRDDSGNDSDPASTDAAQPASQQPRDDEQDARLTRLQLRIESVLDTPD